MKYKNFIILLTCIIVTGLHCSSPSPTEQVQRAAKAAQQGDRATFLACFTPPSQDVLQGLDLLASASNLSILPLKTDGAPSVVSEQIIKNQARVRIREGTTEKTIILTNEDGTWRIDLFAMEAFTLGGLRH